MLLAIDIGNSNIVVGVFDKTNQKWLYQWRMETSTTKTANDYALLLGDLLLENDMDLSIFDSLVLSSVVPPLTQVLKTALKEFFHQEPLVLGANIYHKLPIQIERPHEIGADLVANAMAAYEKYKDDCIIVDFGTALTFTTLAKSGKILGVAIAPGLKTAMYSLFINTAQLPEVPLELPTTALGRNTTEALQAGVLLGYIGLVESLIERIKNEIQTPCKVIATGGLSSVIQPLASKFDEINPNHTLDGLRIIAAYCE